MNINPREKAYGILELQVSFEIPIKFSLKFYGQDDRIIVLRCIFVYNKRISLLQSFKIGLHLTTF